MRASVTFLRWLGLQGTLLLTWGGSKSAPRYNRRIARLLLGCAYPFLKREVRRARRTLSDAAYQLRVKDSDAFLRRMFANFGKSALDVAYVIARGPGAIDELVEAENRREFEEQIRRRQQHGGGVYFSAHLGNWELLSAIIARVAPFAAVARRLDYPEYQELVEKIRQGLGVRIYYQEEPLRSMVKFLKDGGILGLLPDQDIRHNAGLFVPFLGRPAYSPIGPAVLAALAKVPLVPVFMPHWREEGGRASRPRLPCRDGYRLVTGEIIPPPANHEPETLLEVTAACQRAIEEAVKAFPDQWAWFHPRYRTRPEQVG